ncbi:zinc finger C3HC-type protein 1-like [Convolutriloba macropyga]|uniref:zinc finger C3HC-type protein 1-like n=1 Tax=Convolutriloba macropyga TaxID=536237 RepID=UPI003F523207
MQNKVLKILNDLTSSDQSSEVSDAKNSMQSKLSPIRSGGEADQLHAFNQRLISFCTSKWFAKPLSMSPIVCAQYGWNCADVNTLLCSSCEEKIVLKGDKSEEDYVALIQSGGHNPICKWASSPLSPTLTYRIEDVKLLLAANLNKLKKLSESDNFIAEKFWGVETFNSPEYEDLEEQRSALEERIINLPEELSSTTPRLLDLSICGWKVLSVDLISCQKCKRRVKSTQFANREFDPIKQHFFWCPWVCSYEENETDVGWIRNLKTNVKSPFKLNKSDVACEHGIESVKTVRTLFRAL